MAGVIEQECSPNYVSCGTTSSSSGDAAFNGYTKFAVSTGSGSTGNAYQDASKIAFDVGSLVANQISKANGFFECVSNQTLDAINDLTCVKIQRPDPVPNIDPVFDITVSVDTDPVTPSDFGIVEDIDLGPAPSPDTLPSIDDVNIQPFNPTSPRPNIQPIPTLDPDLQAPIYNVTKPTIETPEDFNDYIIQKPDYVLINVDEFVKKELDDFSANFPTLQTQELITFVDWVEPEYQEVVIDDAINQLMTYFQGGTGIRPAVEEAIVNRGKDREDRITHQAESQAENEWATRGYTAPPGMMAKRLDQIREENTIKKQGLNREVVIRAMDVEIENLRFAVQQGIAAEQIFVNIFLAAAQRTFQMAQFNAQLAINVYNLYIAAYNAKLQEVQVQLEVYKVDLQKYVTDIEVYKAEIQAEEIKSRINTNKVEQYKAEVAAKESQVKVFIAQWEAVKTQLESYKIDIEAYGELVRAYGVEVNAEKLKFDAYDSHVRGEASKVGMLEAEARAYAAEVQGVNTGVQAQKAALDGAVNGYEAEVRGYLANLEKEKTKTQNQLAAIEARVRGFIADTERYRAQAGAEAAAAGVEIQELQTEENVKAERYKAYIAQYQTDYQMAIEHAKILQQGAIAQGQIASTVAAGSMASQSVSAQLQGSGQVQASGGDRYNLSNSYSKSCDTNTSVSYKIEATNDPDVGCSF